MIRMGLSRVKEGAGVQTEDINGPGKSDAVRGRTVMTVAIVLACVIAVAALIVAFALSRKTGSTVDDGSATPAATEIRLRNERLLAIPAGDWEGPAWRPDGNAIVASRVETSGSQLWLIPLDGSPPIQLTFGPGTHKTAPGRAWGPLGLLYSGDESGELDVWLLDTRTLKSRRLGWDGSEDIDPTWSPNGMDVTFARRTVGAGSFAVWTANIDPGRPPVRTTQASFDDALKPQWSFDGKRILFQLGPAGRRDLFTVGAPQDPPDASSATSGPPDASSSASAPPEAPAAASSPADAPTDGGPSAPLVVTAGDQMDGVWLDGAGDVLFADAPTSSVPPDLFVFAGGVIQRLSSGSAAERAPSVSKDGKHVAFERGAFGSRGIAVADLVRSPARR